MNDHTQRERLATWLAAWRLDRAMAAADGDAAETAEAGEPAAGARAAGVAPRAEYAARAAPPRAGDVLLLKPLTPLTRRRPVYVLVLGRGGARGTRQVAPFARFEVPATPGEAGTGLAPPPLRVLALWNRRTVPAARLAALAWPVLRLSRTQRLEASAAGETRRGPPLVHPLDPRHDYLDEERRLWPEWEAAGEGLGWGDGRVAEGAVLDTWELARAAETSDNEYGGHFPR